VNTEKWSERLVAFAAATFITVLVVRWAWAELEPMLPVLVGAFVVYCVIAWRCRS